MLTFDNYADQLKEYDAFLASEFGMVPEEKSPNRYVWSNQVCTLRIGLERYYPDINIVFIRKSDQKNFHINQVYIAKDLLGKVNHPQEILDHGESIPDPIARDLFYKADFLKRHCREILLGDFSVFGAN